MIIPFVFAVDPVMEEQASDRMDDANEPPEFDRMATRRDEHGGLFHSQAFAAKKLKNAAFFEGMLQEARLATLKTALRAAAIGSVD